MTDPLVGGIPLSLLILYFLLYSFLGWAMETLYCSIGEKRFVARGFLYGPVCPIYGVGALIMILPLSHFRDNLPLFLVVSIVCLSAWEYLVACFWKRRPTSNTGITAHIVSTSADTSACKNSLAWGVLAYAAVFWIHPAVAGFLSPLVPELRRNIAVFFSGVILVDFGGRFTSWRSCGGSWTAWKKRPENCGGTWPRTARSCAPSWRSAGWRYVRRPKRAG
jgi:uncharacterized membrane protein